MPSLSSSLPSPSPRYTPLVSGVSIKGVQSYQHSYQNYSLAQALPSILQRSYKVATTIQYLFHRLYIHYFKAFGMKAWRQGSPGFSAIFLCKVGDEIFFKMCNCMISIYAEHSMYVNCLEEKAKKEHVLLSKENCYSANPLNKGSVYLFH